MEFMAAAVAATSQKVPLFTIEQIELIRRLRNSGITKDQVLQAFEELERMDAELGRALYASMAGTPVNNGTPAAATTAAAPGSSASSTTSSSNGSTPTAAAAAAAAAAAGTAGHGGVATAATASLINPFTYLQLQHHLLRQLSVAAQMSSAGAANHAEQGLDYSVARSPSQNSESPPTTPQSAAQHMSGGYLLTPSLPRVVNGHHETFIEDQVELQDFMRQGDACILEEIRKFVMRYNIKQHFIAEMAKISQAYVSRYFRGEVSEMSERTKIAIYSWYLTCKKNPWKLKQICPNSGVKRMVSDSGDLIPLKRERFTFKSAHLAILEKYYNMDPYPDSQTREQIVEECNRAMNRDLTEREKVTINVVTNWFNNRRKEAKQKLRQQDDGTFLSLSDDQITRICKRVSDNKAGIQGLDISQSMVTSNWEQLPTPAQSSSASNWDHLPTPAQSSSSTNWEQPSTPAQIVCQPDIEPSESDQSQDDLVEAMRVSPTRSLDAMRVSPSGNLDDSLLEAAIKEEPDSEIKNLLTRM